MAHFVAERYVASADSEGARADLDRIRRAASRVGGVSFVEAVYLPADELCLYVFASESAAAVAEVARAAAVVVDRIRVAEVSA